MVDHSEPPHFQLKIFGRLLRVSIPIKPTGHDNISIHMLKICVDDISKQLEVILSQVLASGSLPSEWKKVILSSFTKKDE